MSRLFRMCLPVLVVLGFTSCLKEKSVDSTEDGGVGILRMKIDGKQWSANKAASATIMNGFVSIAGASQDNINLLISVQTDKAGTFQLDQVSAHLALVIDNNEATPVAYATNQGANSSIAGGTVNITSIDAATKRISGNFTFKVYRSSDDKSLMITEGYFENLSYTAEAPPTGTDGNKMQYTAAGANIVAQQVITSTAQPGLLLINGVDAAASRMMAISVPTDIAPATYTLDDTSPYELVYTVGSTFYISESGQLIITENNATTKTIKGTFSFTGKEQTGTATGTIAITNGSFSATY